MMQCQRMIPDEFGATLRCIAEGTEVASTSAGTVGGKPATRHGYFCKAHVHLFRPASTLYNVTYVLGGVSRMTTVEIIAGYTTPDDIPRILATAHGKTEDDIYVTTVTKAHGQ